MCKPLFWLCFNEIFETIELPWGSIILMTQNTTHITHIALILLGGFVGGLIGNTFFGGPELSVAVDAGSAEASTPSEFVTRLQNVEGSIAGMKASLDEMKTTLSERRREPLPSNPSASSGRSNASAGGLKAGEEERFSSYLEKREDAKAAERKAEEDERRAERATRRVERYVERLGLDSYQSQEMARIMATADEERSSYFREMRDSGDWDREAVREAMQEMSSNTTDQLSQLLNDDQMSEYESMQSEGRGGWGGWGGGGRGDRGDRGGGQDNGEF